MKRLFVAIVLAALFLTSALSAQVGTGGDTVWTRAIGAVEQVRFSPDGTTIYASYLYDSGKPAVALDAQTGEIIRQFPGMNAYRIDLSADGKYLAGCELISDGAHYSVYEWNAQTGELVGTYGPEGAELKYFVINDVSYSPDGKYLGGIYYRNKEFDKNVFGFVIWDRATRKITYQKDADPAKRLLFSPDGKYLALCYEHGSTGANYVELYKTDDWKLYATLAGHTDAIEDMSFSPDSKYLATGGREGTLKVWDVNKKQIYWEVPKAQSVPEVHPSDRGVVQSVVFINSNYNISGGGGYAIPPKKILWHVPTKQLITTIFSWANKDMSTNAPAYVAAGNHWGVDLLDFSKYLGIKEKNNKKDSRILPNPTRGNTTLHFYPSSDGKYKISLFDSGMKEIKILKEEFLQEAEQLIEIDVEKLVVGTYFVQIKSEQGVEYVSFVVAR
ncbi:MAG: T9SS type A sorting domain-containing protein [Chloroflexota bacterium]